MKYNPCTVYARGSSCSYFRGSRKCSKPPLSCKLPEYDKWYKDVLNGKRKCFYPNRSRLLENSDVPMFLFHSHRHAIVGETTIVSSTVDNGNHYYWFNEFLLYPYPVELELIEIDPRLRKLSRKGRWRSVYINTETIDEIRYLSKLSEEARKKLGRNIKRLLMRVKPHPKSKPSSEVYMKKESERLMKNHELDEQVLAETRKYFLKAVGKKLSKGRSLDALFYASLYLAFRMMEIPMLPHDIARISGIPLKKILKMYRLLNWEFGFDVPPVDPKQLIKSYSIKLNIASNTINKALSILDEVHKSKMNIGKSPSSVAAVATFIACHEEGEKRSQKDIAKTYKVSTETIRNYSRKLKSSYQTITN